MWVVQFERRAFKDLQRLGTVDQRRVQRFVDERLTGLDDPRLLGTALTGELAGFWRYRVGKIRLITRIDDGKLVVLVVSVGNRREIYR